MTEGEQIAATIDDEIGAIVQLLTGYAGASHESVHHSIAHVTHELRKGAKVDEGDELSIMVLEQGVHRWAARAALIARVAAAYPVGALTASEMARCHLQEGFGIRE